MSRSHITGKVPPEVVMAKRLLDNGKWVFDARIVSRKMGVIYLNIEDDEGILGRASNNKRESFVRTEAKAWAKDLGLKFREEVRL